MTEMLELDGYVECSDFRPSNWPSFYLPCINLPTVGLLAWLPTCIVAEWIWRSPIQNTIAVSLRPKRYPHYTSMSARTATQGTRQLWVAVNSVTISSSHDCDSRSPIFFQSLCIYSSQSRDSRTFYFSTHDVLMNLNLSVKLMFVNK